MFLAWNEVKYNKLRFILIAGVLMLVSYLVFFLSGLANGLEQLNREAVDKWNADGIILTEEANINLPRSTMNIEDFNPEKVNDAAVLGQLNAIASVNDDLKSNVSIFGIRTDEFIMPEVTEGSPFSAEGEVIADDTLKEEGFRVGDELEISSSDAVLTITGFTDNARFSAAPVLYSSLETVQTVQYDDAAENNEGQINGIVIRDDNIDEVSLNGELQMVDTSTFIESLPGYTEQNLTLNFMIYFLFIISSVILAIFLYVLTIQKISMFGVMKAQGISSRYLANSVIAQTFLLAFAGVIIGFLLAVVTGYFLPPAVPVAFDYTVMLVYGMVLIAVSVLGAFFSVRTIVKIDPLLAIGG
ncbi:ABC transporter permease [Virgibacillus sp. NKC19-16]|uniref:ABC transporter permease n=1 Tax=Virgibacillus salidurans TaxID=2831673 RepID=UPI001F3A38AC|nr:ABC transporter permease [Virgibacillus sp. NKC19-16]UJL46171.1 ABC transporter permease [Virgibacillus sp. NKC19-16]